MFLAKRIDFAALMEPVALKLLGEPNTNLSNPPRDVRFGSRGSMAVDYENGRWFDHENQVGGGVLDLIAYKTGCNTGEALAWLRREGIGPAGRTPSPPPCHRAPAVRTMSKFVEAYSYTDETGNPLFEVVRYDPKDFKQRRAGSTPGSWIWNLDGVRRVLYRLPDLIAAVRDRRTVAICEGEKDANAVRSLGFVATTAVGGANKWQASYNEVFRNADVVLLPHNDRAGRDHVGKVAASLHGIASRVRVLDLADTAWPECPKKGDVSDWIAFGGGTAERLQEQIEATADWSPSPVRLRPLDLREFLQLSVKPREMLLDPILPEKGLAMLYAARGTGKTHVALGICFAIATGTKFLKWHALKARRVLLIDGEMPAAALQERFATIVASAPDVDLDPDKIRILAGDLIEVGAVSLKFIYRD